MSELTFVALLGLETSRKQACYMCQTRTTTIYVITHVVQASCAKQPRKVPATWRL